MCVCVFLPPAVQPTAAAAVVDGAAGVVVVAVVVLVVGCVCVCVCV